MTRALLAALAALILVPASAAADNLAGQVSVIDGQHAGDTRHAHSAVGHRRARNQPELLKVVLRGADKEDRAVA
jgi:hypothetical protein